MIGFDPEVFRQVVFIGAFTGLVLGLTGALIGVAIDFLYQKIRKIS